MDLPAAMLLAITLTITSVTDIRQRLIPNQFLLLAAAIALLILVRSGAGQVINGLLAAIVISCPLFLAAILRPAGMGMGDAKLVAVIALYMGWQALPALLAGLALAGLAGTLICLGKRQPPGSTTLPLAPFLAAGTLPVALLGLQALQ